MLPNCSKFLNRNDQTFGYVFHDTNEQKSWANIEDPVVPLERNVYGHPLAGLLWERQFEEAVLELGWEKIPELWECMFVHRQQGLFLSEYVDDMKIVGRKQYMAPMEKKLMEHVDFDEPTSFLDHVYLGCTQRECKPNESIIEQDKKMFESCISAGAGENYRDGKNLTRKPWRGDTVNWQTRKWSNCTKFQVLAWMIINSSKKNSNLLENCQKYAHRSS